MDTFTPDPTFAAPPRRMQYERILPEMYLTNNTDKVIPGARDARLSEAMNQLGLSESEAVIMDQAHHEVIKAVLPVIGRVIDEVSQNKGLRFMALPYVLRGLSQNMVSLGNIVERMMVEMVLFEEPITTPNCDCAVCQLGHAMSENADIAERTGRPVR